MDLFIQQLSSYTDIFKIGIFTTENFPIAVLYILPWIALITIIMVVIRNQTTTLVADRNRAFTCSLFLGISALSWGTMCIQPGLPYALLWAYLPVSIPLLAMTIACIVIITKTLKHEHCDTWLRLLVVTSAIYPIILLSGLCVLILIYSGFAIITALWWIIFRHQHKEED